MTSSKGSPLLLCRHGFFDSALVPTVSGVTVTVTVAASLRQRKVSVAFLPSLLSQFVPVVFYVRLLLQSNVIHLETNVGFSRKPS